MAQCEVCRQKLVAQDDRLHCPACGQPLAILKACGAVDYFCSHGDGLIAKKRVTPSLANEPEFGISRYQSGLNICSYN